MICPYLKEKTIKIDTSHLPLKDSTTIENTETFHRCMGGECPFYHYNPYDVKDYCLKVHKETVLIINSKGEIE